MAKLLLILSLIALSSAHEGFLEAQVLKLKAACAQNDPIGCLQFKVVSFLASVLQSDHFKIGDVALTRNNYRANEVLGRSELSTEEAVEEYIKSHDVSFPVPMTDAKLTIDSRNLDEEQLNLKLRFGGQSEARRSKIKKIVTPILVFVLLKAMTLVPLALGMLGFKAWIGLQLSFLSFAVAVGLAVFQLCKKIASEHAPPHIAAHPPWEAQYAARSLGDPQVMAYSGYVKQ